ncbi:MAG: ABC transporter permease subunit [Acidimicrobiales bacterium]
MLARSGRYLRAMEAPAASLETAFLELTADRGTLVIRLIRTELVRFASRRVAWVTALVAATLILVAFVITFTQTSSEAPDNSAAEAIAAEQAQQCIDSINSMPEGDLALNFPDLAQHSGEERDQLIRDSYCYQDPAWFGASDDRFFATQLLNGGGFQTNEITDWSAQRIDTSRPSYSDFGSGEVRSANNGLDGIVPGVAVFALVLSIIIGASFVGAEYRAGTVENLLLWEPRRGRVMAAKFGAGFLSSAALTALVLAWLTGLFYVLASVHGSTQGVDGRFWIDVAPMVLRAGCAGGLFFVIAMSIAVVARNTTAPVGVILGWFAISNILIQLVFRGCAAGSCSPTRSPSSARATCPGSRRSRDRGSTSTAMATSPHGLVVAVWAAVLGGTATAVFVRRDIS